VRSIGEATHARRYGYSLAHRDLLLSCIQVTRSSLERDPESRNYYQALISELYPPQTHVYLDESACNRHTSNRDRAWAPIGDRARRHDYFVRGTRYVSQNSPGLFPHYTTGTLFFPLYPLTGCSISTSSHAPGPKKNFRNTSSVSLTL
jgi:hypothetical protein